MACLMSVMASATWLRQVVLSDIWCSDGVYRESEPALFVFFIRLNVLLSVFIQPLGSVEFGGSLPELCLTAA